MKKAQNKPNLSINTPNQKCNGSEPSSVNNYNKTESKNNRYHGSRTNSTKPSNSNSIQSMNKIVGSKTPNATTNKLSFLKTKFSVVHARESLIDDLLSSNFHVKTDPSPSSRIERSENSLSSSSLGINKTHITPRNITLETERIETKKKRKISPIHMKSNSLTRPIVALDSNLTLLKIGTSSVSHKNNSISSIDSLAGSSYFLNHPSIILAKGFENTSREEESSINLQSLKSANLNEDRCSNHPHKKAKYYVILDSEESEGDNKYCSKCAIKMATSGIKLQEILNSDEALRKSELEEFLISLSSCKRSVMNYVSGISKKKEDLTNYFGEQNSMVKTFYEEFEKFIKDEKARNLNIINSNKEDVFKQMERIENDLNTHISDLNNIQTDIDTNIENIIKKIAIEPFKNIINQYETKINQVEEVLNSLKNETIMVNKIPSITLKVVEKMKSQLAVLYSPVKLKTSLIKKVENSSDKKNKKLESSGNEDKTSVFISFENKEIFGNALSISELSTIRTEESECKKEQKTPKSSFGAEFSTDSSKKDAKIFKADEPVVQPFMSKESIKVPLKELHLDVSSLALKTEYYDVPTNHKKQSLKIEAFDDDNKENIPPEWNMNGAGAGSHKSTKKYINILDKINANQTKKNLYYSNIMRNNPISPRYMSSYMDDTVNIGGLSKGQIEELDNEESISIQNPLNTNSRKYETNSVSPNLNHVKSNPLKNNDDQFDENPMHYLDDDEVRMSNCRDQDERKPGFQKTLFCSPHFKDFNN